MPSLDLTSEPNWQPLRGQYRVGPWAIDTWEEPRVPGEIGLDTYLVAVFDQVVRIAVFDGAENLVVANSHANTSRAVHTARGWLRSLSDVDAALGRAAQDLVDPDLRPRSRNPLCTLAVADISPDGSVRCWRCGDSEVWARQDNIWHGVLVDEMLAPATLERWTGWIAAHPNADTAESWVAFEQLRDDPTDYITPYLGLTTSPNAQTATLDSFEELLIATDGPMLNTSRCADLDRWMGHDVQQLQPTWPHSSPHGDMAYVRVRHA